MDIPFKILIVEDEPIAANQLMTLIKRIRPKTECIGICDTIKSAVQWINNNPAPDLAFFDIQLGDGLSFEVFKQAKFNTPVIFTTAFNQYTLQAFKVNSIDYLLKPIDNSELEKAVIKFETNHLHKASFTNEQLQMLIQSVDKPTYKKRFLVKVGTHLKTIHTADILYFFSFEKGTYFKCNNNHTYTIDYTLDYIEQLIDPSSFFRINRKYIVALSAINDVSVYSNSRLKLKTQLADNNDFLVAREKVKDFKQWLEGE
jgi:DNA-binding LytR/AlgR family response regulator